MLTCWAAIYTFRHPSRASCKRRTHRIGTDATDLVVVLLCLICHRKNQVVLKPACHTASGPSHGGLHQLLQCPSKGCAGVCGEAASDGPGCDGGGSGFQPTHIIPPADGAPLATCSCQVNISDLQQLDLLSLTSTTLFEPVLPLVCCVPHMSVVWISRRSRHSNADYSHTLFSNGGTTS